MRGAILLAGMLIALPAQAAGPFAKFSVGNWRGGAFTDEETGRFSHCVVSASYKSGVVMHASITSGLGWNIGFSHRNWALKPCSTMPVELTFDRRDVLRVDARAAQPQLLVVGMPPNSDIVRAFRGARYLEASMVGGRYTFALTSTAEVMPALLDCVKRNAQLVVVPGGGPAGNAAAPARPAQDQTLQLEAVTTASNFLLASGMTEPKVLSGSEAPAGIGRGAVAWRSSEASGIVRIVDTPNQKDTDIAAMVASSDARSCEGKFASGRTTEPSERGPIVRGFSSCEDGKGTRFSEYYVLARKAGGFAVFSIVTSGNARPLPTDRRSALQRAALTAAQ